LSNAIKFTPRGGNISVAGRVKDDELLISVQDSGIGIAESEKQKLFKSFVQLNSQGKHPKEGTGLGLALVKEFVQMQGGRVWVESEIGKGSTFTFTLPLLQ
jgi:signal transduction histidine kinase